jgi:hypothetical protein
MTLARFLSTNGPYLEAKIEVAGQRLVVMDELTLDVRSAPHPGDEIEIDLSAEIDPEESWEAIFAGNPQKLIGLERLDGWRYAAYGQIVSITPVVVDCGVIKVSDVVHTNDDRVVGEYVGFTVTRLGAY